MLVLHQNDSHTVNHHRRMTGYKAEVWFLKMERKKKNRRREQHEMKIICLCEKYLTLEWSVMVYVSDWNSWAVSLCCCYYCCCCYHHFSLFCVAAAAGGTVIWVVDDVLVVCIGIGIGVGHHHSIFDSHSLAPPF